MEFPRAAFSNTLPSEHSQITRTRFAVTSDNVQEFIKAAERKENVQVGKKFQTQLFRMQNSNWTPVIHKPSSDQLFNQRKELIANWFDLWSGSQRRQFLDMLMRHCTRRQLAYLYNWFTQRVPPLHHLDFTTVLPRYLSLKIFSYLDPRSLCRSACVAWHWKFLSEQDVLWQPKCVRHGWYLPFEAPEHEYGAWKRHYIACIYTLDMELSTRTVSTADAMKELLNRGKKSNKRSKSTANVHLARSSLPDGTLLELRPPWIPNDKTPRDNDRSRKLMHAELTESVVRALARFDRRTISSSARAVSAARGPGLPKVNDGGIELMETPTAAVHRLTVDNVDKDLTHSLQRAPLSCTLSLESHEGRRLKDLINMPSEPPKSARATSRRPDLSNGAMYPSSFQQTGNGHLSGAIQYEERPRLILLSSRVPAAEILLDAVLFNVTPVVYEYEGTTLENLLHRIEQCLRGRLAQSIGIFVHGDVSWELCVVDGAVISIDNIDRPDYLHFFTKLSTLVVPVDDHGHIDIFVPLNSCKPGSDLVDQLSQHTRMQYSTPTGIVGSYNRIYGEWSSTAEVSNVHIPLLYFCDAKLLLWSKMAEKAVEACRTVRSIIGQFFQKHQNDVVSQLVGEILFDSVSKAGMSNFRQVSTALVDGLACVGRQSDAESSLRLLGEYLLREADMKQTGRDPLAASLTRTSTEMGTLKPSKSMRPGTLSEHLKRNDSSNACVEKGYGSEEEEDDGEGEPSSSEVLKRKDIYNSRVEKDNGADSDTEYSIEEEIDEDDAVPATFEQKSRPAKSTVSFDESIKKKSASDTAAFNSTRQTLEMNKSITLSGAQWNAQIGANRDVDRRQSIAREILSSESDYCLTLDVVYNVFYVPCKSALESNRAIISAQNLQIIFTDVLQLRGISQLLLSLLRPRLDAWDMHQCLGDVFVELSAKLKTFVNFFKSYPAVLSAIERCTEQIPVFRSFLRRHERTLSTKMLTLPELLLEPVRRVENYVSLLAALRHSTPLEHADIANLDVAIKSFTNLHRLVQQCKLRCQQERDLVRIQKTIVNCPSLLESNRYFIKHIDVIRLQPPSDETIRPEMRVYQHVETIGLFLFNDALVVAQRTTRFVPFERYSDNVYTFNACALLSRLEVTDIPDSKYIQNAFRLHTPSRDWFCAVNSDDEKRDWMSIADKAIEAANVAR